MWVNQWSASNIGMERLWMWPSKMSREAYAGSSSVLLWIKGGGAPGTGVLMGVGREGAAKEGAHGGTRALRSTRGHCGNPQRVCLVGTMSPARLS